MMSKHRRGPWSQGEDNFLLQLVHSHGPHNWVRISQMIQSRSPKQCRERYHQNLKPSLNLDPITPEEGVLIERMVAEMGKRWAEIARRLNGRSDNAVKNWWNGGMNRRKRLDTRHASRQSQQQFVPPQDSIRPQQLPFGNVLIPQQSQQQQQQQQQAAAQQSQQQFQPQMQAYGMEHRQYAQGFPHALQTQHLMPQQHRQLFETPLASPSTYSNFSHPESADGGPPSLVSDRSYASGQHSPSTTTPISKDLPSLGTSSNDSRRASMPQVHLASQGQAYAIDPMLHANAKQYSQMSYQTPTPQGYWRESSAGRGQDGLAYPRQLPLPPFNTVTAPELRHPGAPPSPPRDNRMNLRSVIH